MKRLALLPALALAFIVVTPAVAAAPTSPFTGSWVGSDPAPPEGDGSTLLLEISGGPSPRITFVDLYGSICVNDGAPTVVFASRLRGTVDGDHLDAWFTSARCGSTYFDWLVGSPASYQYDAATDTLTDGFATFHRR